MNELPLLDVAAGLLLVYAVTAALASVITEGIAWFLGLRARYLIEGIKSLVDGDSSNDAIDFRQVSSHYQAFRRLMQGAVQPTRTEKALRDPNFTPTSALLGGPILGNLGLLEPLEKIQKKSTPEGKLLPGAATLRHYPSYFSSRAFSAALLDLLLPDVVSTKRRKNVISDVRSSVEKINNKALKESLLGILKSTEEDLGKFRQGIEQWYDDHMDRVSGWYKRRISWVTLLAGFVLVVSCNINTVAIARTLYTDADTRTAVTAIVNSKPCTENDEACIDELRNEVTALTASGLPLGWREVPADCPKSDPKCTPLSYNNLPDINKGVPSLLLDVLLLIAGFGLTIVAVLPGARFWYDLLTRIGGLRRGSPSYAGPKPPQASST